MYYVYQTISPIDQFLGCQSLSKLLEQEEGNISATVYENGKEIVYYYTEEINNQYEEAEQAVIQAGFNFDDLRDGRDRIMVFSIPDIEFNCRLGFIFKEDNNGNTFIVSPFELPHFSTNSDVTIFL